MIEFYVARDDRGLNYFSDCPDLVKFNPNDNYIEWTGYPFSFGNGIGSQIKMMVEAIPEVYNIELFDTPIHIRIDNLKVTVVK